MKTPTVRPIEIHGYALISDDNMIAAADGLTPPTLRNEKDWEYYQNALARSDLIVFGRRSHELEPNHRGDRRVVISRGVAGFARRADAWWWNPETYAWATVVEELLPAGGEVAAPGGQSVFDLFLRIGYSAFHLSRKRGIALPGGRSVFSACAAGRSAEDVLSDSGLHASERIPLDPEHGVEMNVWRRK
jgi:hypothetical protein